MLIAAFSAAAVSAEFVGGKATRDALFLTALDITALPAMLVVTSLCSIVLATLYARGSRRVAPAVLVPAASVVSGVLFLVEWFLRPTAPLAIAVAVYLHVSVIVPLLGSGFWLIASERFDPRAAKRLFGRIAAAGTLGGLAGALISERLAVWSGVPSMLLCLAVFQFAAAGLVRALALSDPVTRRAPASHDQDGAPLRSSARVLARAPHLRHLMALVVLGTVAAALLDYLFKARAVDAFGRGDSLLRFFSIYYAGTSIISFVLQTFGSRAVLERFGLGLAASSPSIALLAGCLVSLVVPGFGGILVARGGEAAFRGSWFRAGYELFYTPLAAKEKRAAKSLIDVALDRFGDALGGGLVRLIIAVAPAAQSSAMLFGAIACSAGAILAASQLNRWYIRTLETSLVDQGGDLDLSDTNDGGTSRVIVDLRQRRRTEPSPTAATTTAVGAPDTGAATVSLDPLLQDIVALRNLPIDVVGPRNRDDQAVLNVLSRPDGIAAPLVSHVIPLLASARVGDYAVFALRKVAEEHVGELTDALLDPNQHFDVRRRLARVFSVCVSQRAADGLLLALDDPRFDVRFHAVRSLNAIVEKNPRILIDRLRIEAAVLKDIEAARPIWASQRLLEQFESDAPVDIFLRDRAARSLGHVFGLLSLVLPREPLQIALRSLHSEDHHLRGTALEYLEGVLPAAIRQQIWPFLVRSRNRVPAQPRAEIVAELLRSHPSVTLLNVAGHMPKRGTAGFAAV
jgi:ATP:ADP antiporter, AAA family